MADELAKLPDDAALFKGATEPEPSPDPPSGQDGGAPSPSPTDGKVSPPEGAGAPPPAPTPPEGDKENVPSWRLREESEARRTAEERASKAERDLQALVEAIQSDLKKEEGKGKAPATDDFFADPKQAVEAIVLESIRPLVEHAHQSRMALARLVASQAHTEKALVEAEEAFLKSIENKTLDTADYETVVQSPNRYNAVVNWHKRQKVMAEVGPDPSAYFEKLLETKLADPAFQTQLLEKIRGGAAASGSSVVSLPPSLSKQTSAARASDEVRGDLSDASLFQFARPLRPGERG